MKKLAIATALALTITFAANSFAAPAPTDPKKQTPQGLYIDAKETQALMKKDPNVILVDVRTPAEWQFVGHTHDAQIMIPSVFFKYDGVDEKKPRYRSMINSDFVSQLEEQAAELGADEESTYVLMCRSGATRAQPAAKMLFQYGYKNVYVMTDGFEGGKTKVGDKSGFRLQNGWKNSGAEWTYKIETQRAFLEK